MASATLFENFTSGENIFFQTDIKLVSNLELYSSLHESDYIVFVGFSRELVNKPELSLKHTHFYKNDKRIYFHYKTEEDRQYVDEMIKNLEAYQTKTSHDLIGELAIQHDLPPVPSLYVPKVKKKSKKKKSKKGSSKEVKKDEEEEQQTSEKKQTPKEDIPEPIIKDNFYNGLYVNPYFIAACASPSPPCGECTKKETPCYACSVFATLFIRRDTFFAGKDQAYRMVAIEHPWFFQQIFGNSVFRTQTRTPREQIVIAYSMLEIIMKLISNPTQTYIGHTETWYRKAKQDRTEAYNDILEYERNHPLDLNDKSMNVRFQKLEQFVFTKFKYFVKNSDHEESRRIADHKYSDCKELNFDRQPAPYNNKLSEELFRSRMEIGEGVKVTPV